MSPLKWIWDLSKGTGYRLASFLAGVLAEIVEKIYPMALGLLYYLLYLAFPIILIIALLPGNSWWMSILDYMRLLLFAHLIPIALMWGDQFANAMLNTNIIAKVVYSSDSYYSSLFGKLIPSDIVDRLTINANLARGLGSLLSLFTPFVLYMIVARGSLTGFFSALSMGVSTVGVGLSTAFSMGTSAIAGTAGGVVGAGIGGATGGAKGAMRGAWVGMKHGSVIGGYLGSSLGRGFRF